jgi:homoserine dehydrogenase
VGDAVTVRELRIGMLGCGTVGSAVARMLAEHGDDIERRAGVRLRIARAAVRDASASTRGRSGTPPTSTSSSS